MVSRGSYQLTRFITIAFGPSEQHIAARVASCNAPYGSTWRFLTTWPWFTAHLHTPPFPSSQTHAPSLHLSEHARLRFDSHTFHLPATSCTTPLPYNPSDRAFATCHIPSAPCDSASATRQRASATCHFVHRSFDTHPHPCFGHSHRFSTIASAQLAPDLEYPPSETPTQAHHVETESLTPRKTAPQEASSLPPLESSRLPNPPSNASAPLPPSSGGASVPPTPHESSNRSNPQEQLTQEPPKTRSSLERRPTARKTFSLEKFFAEGGAEKPWYQLSVELAVAEDQGYFIHPADMNRIVSRCAWDGNHDAALMLHQNYQDAKFWPGPYIGKRRKGDLADRATSILIGLLRNNQPRRAMALTAELSKDVGSQHVLFDRLLLQFARNGDASEDARGDGVRELTVEDGLKVVDSMVSNGLRPTRIGMESLIDCCDAALNAEMAEEIVRRMDEEYGLPPTVVTIVRLLRACVNADDEERALRALDRLPREDLRSRDIQMLVMQTLMLQYEHAAESREADEAPETMPRLRHKLDEILREESKRARMFSGLSPLIQDAFA